MKYYSLELEVAGGFGERTVINRSSGRMIVEKLHYQFDGWLGSELLESTPCYIISERLVKEIMKMNVTGAYLDEVDVTTSDQFRELHPNLQLPAFLWLKVTGRAGHDDFGVAPGLRLVVSERVLDLLRQGGISEIVEVAPFVF